MTILERLTGNIKTLTGKQLSSSSKPQDVGITRLGFGSAETEREAIYPQW